MLPAGSSWWVGGGWPAGWPLAALLHQLSLLCAIGIPSADGQPPLPLPLSLLLRLLLLLAVSFRQ